MMQGENRRIVLAVVLGLIATNFTGDLAQQLPIPALISNIPYVHSGISYLIDIAVMLTLLRLVGGVTLSHQWDAVGLSKPWRPAALMAICLFSPILFVGAMFGSVVQDFSWPEFAFLSLLAPFAEEFTYRGLGTGILLVMAGWRFWSAALLPAAVFGLLHAGQGEGPMEIALVVAITGVGGLFFSWLYVRFGQSLWPAVVMHIGMNAVWNIYDLGDNAIGGLLGNGLRAASVLGAIAFALWGQRWLERISRTKSND